MMDDQDQFLTRLFAQQGHQRIHRIATIIAGVIAAALLAPLIAQVAATAIGWAAAGVTATRPILDFPMAWLVVCSIVASFLPVVYLGITRRW